MSKPLLILIGLLTLPIEVRNRLGESCHLPAGSFRVVVGSELEQMRLQPLSDRTEAFFIFRWTALIQRTMIGTPLAIESLFAEDWLQVHGPPRAINGVASELHILVAELMPGQVLLLGFEQYGVAIITVDNIRGNPLRYKPVTVAYDFGILLGYLQRRSRDIWTAPLVEVARKVADYQLSVRQTQERGGHQ